MSDDLARERKSQATINAYHRVFETQDGKMVLDDFKASFGLHMPAFIPQTRGRHCEYDPLHAAIRDGQRQVMLHIETKLAQNVEGEANIEKPKSKVKK